MDFSYAINKLRSGDLSVIDENLVRYMNQESIRLINLQYLNEEDIKILDQLIIISNILYNNTDADILPLEDGIYDMLMTMIKRYKPDYQVGAEPIVFKNTSMALMKEESHELMSAITRLPKEKIEEGLFIQDINKTPDITRDDLLMSAIYRDEPITKRVINMPHKYPNLVGTLDKCKFVLNKQAEELGVLNQENVEIFERDFIQKHIREGILDPKREFYMVAELKYDGISVEADVSNEIISARSRGDTNNNIATDLTPILKGYTFKHAKEIPHDNVFGMKFEAIITSEDLYRLGIARGKEYANCRNAIIGLFGASDANMFRDYITLVPLATSLEVDRLTEIEFLNKYYHSGVYLKYAVLHGDYKSILFQVKRFVEEAEYMRQFMPFMYDGVVLSYIEPDLIDALGRENSVNKYSVAIKFNPMKRQTVFTGYEFTVGQDGSVTPMIHYNPVEFYGGIHVKSSGHSYERFKELNLKIGDILDVVYTNDVMPYVTKPDIEQNRNNPNPPVPFPTHCPSCGTPLVMSDSGKSMNCPNIECPERNLIRMVNMMQKLNLKDFSEESLKLIARNSLSELLNLTRDDVVILGDVNSMKFIDRMNEIKTREMYDYDIIGAIGFSKLAKEKWKLILNHISLDELIHLSDEELTSKLVNIKGIGTKAAETICKERYFFTKDITTVLNMQNVKTSKGITNNGKVIRFTGFRNKDLSDRLNALGHDAGEGAITKKTDILLIPCDGFSSTKTLKAEKLGIIIVPVDKFIGNLEEYLK